MSLILLILGLLPGFVWLVFYMEEDTDSEPKREVILAFIAGFAITIVVLFVQRIFISFSDILSLNEASVFSWFGLAIIEEFFKFAAAYVIVSKSKYFDLPIDAMIYMVVVALGFATMENIFAISAEYHNTSFLSAAAETATLRFVGATLLHALASAIVGYHWAKGILHGKLFQNIGIGILIGTLLHTTFNCSISTQCSSVFLQTSPIMFTVLLLIFAGFFVLSDFEKLKHPEKETPPFFKKRKGNINMV